jgi:hypothetical protein
MRRNHGYGRKIEILELKRNHGYGKDLKNKNL